MTPSKRRLAARTAHWRADDARLCAEDIMLILRVGAMPPHAGPTPRERAGALRLATKLRDQADRLISRIMALECDQEE